MNSIKMRKIFMAMLLAVFVTAAVCAAAFAAVGDVVGLIDFNTTQTQRTNTFDSNITGDYFEFNIVKVVETASGDTELQFFSSANEADPANFEWTQLSSVAENTHLDFSYFGVKNIDATHWYYYIGAYSDGDYQAVGPENWHADYSYEDVVTSGDFTITTTDYSDPDSYLAEDKIQIAFYNGPANVPTNCIASGDYALIRGIDDKAVYPAIGRSYPTALDAVGHAFVSGDIELYTKPGTGPGTIQMVLSITKNGITYIGNDTDHTGWMYAVYYSNDGITYTRDGGVDVDSYIFGPDDYKFDGPKKQYYPAYEVWALGYYNAYNTYLPPTLPALK
jgi:hypothetical protein